MYQLNEKRAEIERTAPNVINISILGGYGYGDSPDAGMSIVATTDDDEPLALRCCRELGQELWDRRQQLVEVRPFFSVDDGVVEAMERGGSAANQGKPVMLVDLGDDPGSKGTRNLLCDYVSHNSALSACLLPTDSKLRVRRMPS